MNEASRRICYDVLFAEKDTVGRIAPLIIFNAVHRSIRRTAFSAIKHQQEAAMEAGDSNSEKQIREMDNESS
jgi:hypothetical protein